MSKETMKGVQDTQTVSLLYHWQQHLGTVQCAPCNDAELFMQST